MACPVGGHNSCDGVSLVEQRTTGDNDVISVCIAVRHGCWKNQDLGDERKQWKGQGRVTVRTRSGRASSRFQYVCSEVDDIVQQE